MTKFGFYTDLHLEGETPKHRIDDYPRTLIEKQREVYKIAQEEHCEFMLFGGDWCNNHRIYSYGVIDDSMDIVCNSDMRTYMVIGEHDLYGHNLSSYPTSTLAHIVRRCGMITVLWEPVTLGDIVLYGKHEPDKMPDALAVKKDIAKINIMLCHELITCEEAPFEMINTNTLRNTGFDLIVSGDLHKGYPVHSVDGTWFCNPGSLARRTTADAERFPQMAIISIEKGKTPKIEYRKLQCGKAGSEVFGTSIAEVARSGVGDASVFAKELMKIEASSTDIYDFVHQSGQQAGLRKPVLDYLDSKRPVKMGNEK